MVYSFECKMVVADFIVDGILGLDFLQSNNCTLNMSNCSLIMQNPDVHVPCHYICKIGCYRINLSENIVLPAMSETFSFANLTITAAHGLTTNTGIEEPSRQFESTDRF
jgi:hypothetical protein